MVFLTSNFKSFVKNKVLAKSSKKRNETLQCYQCKGFRYMENECLNLTKEEDNDKKEKEKEKGKGKDKDNRGHIGKR